LVIEPAVRRIVGSCRAQLHVVLLVNRAPRT
jgi:hypothetical protein